MSKMPYNPESKLQEYGAEAARVLAASPYLPKQPYTEERWLGVQVFDGTIATATGEEVDNYIKVLHGTMRNRILGRTALEHTLYMRGIYVVSAKLGVAFEARADLVTGEAKYKSYSTFVGVSETRRNIEAWHRIMAHVTSLSNFFAGRYDGPSR